MTNGGRKRPKLMKSWIKKGAITTNTQIPQMFPEKH
jgi:hypothetical protein